MCASRTRPPEPHPARGRARKTEGLDPSFAADAPNEGQEPFLIAAENSRLLRQPRRLVSFMSIGRPANSLNQFICDFLGAFEGNVVPVRQLWAKGGKALRFYPAQHKKHSLCQ